MQNPVQFPAGLYKALCVDYVQHSEGTWYIPRPPPGFTGVCCDMTRYLRLRVPTFGLREFWIASVDAAPANKARATVC